MAGAAHVNSKTHTKVVLERGIDEDDIVLLVQQRPAGLSTALYHVYWEEIIAGEQVGDGAVKGGRGRNHQYAVGTFLEYHNISSFSNDISLSGGSRRRLPRGAGAG